jgi:hypothetical protein
MSFQQPHMLLTRLGHQDKDLVGGSKLTRSL